MKTISCHTSIMVRPFQYFIKVINNLGIFFSRLGIITSNLTSVKLRCFEGI